MKIIRAFADTTNISDSAIRQLVEQRIYDLNTEDIDFSSLGYLIVVESGDSLDVLTTTLGFPILVNRFSGIHFGQPGFTPSFEFVEEFATCYDMVFIISDDGFGMEVFIPKTADVISDLLSMCKQYAVHSEG